MTEKITLSSVGTGYNLDVINANFDKIAVALNERVLYRDVEVGESNSLLDNLDANGKRIYNLPTPIDANDAARLRDIQNAVTGVTTANLIQADDGASGSLFTTVQGFITKMMSGDGTSFLTFVQNAIGAVTHTLLDKIRSDVRANAVKDFGADPTGLTDSTTAMLNFYNHCIAGNKGHIPAGSYLITPGVLAFDTPFVDKQFPNITTAGYKAVTFKLNSSADAPMLSFTNGTATSGAGKYWLGGYHGGFTVDQNGKTTGSNQHALLIRGLYNPTFGYIRGVSLGGDVLNVPEALYLGNNPDPYAITFGFFDGIEGNFCKGKAVNNLNWVGFNLNKIKILRVIGCEGGGWYGFGAGNEIDMTSMGTVKGWAFDDGTETAASGGAPSRIKLGICELDDVQNGFKINRTSFIEAKQVRFVHRYNFSALNPSEGYWPRVAVDLGGGAAANSTGIKMQLWHRIEAGGAIGNLGVFIDGHNSGGITNFDIENRISDNAGFGISNYTLANNISNIEPGVVSLNGVPVNDTRYKVAAKARSSGAQSIPNTGYGTAASKLAFPTKEYDPNLLYDTTNSWFVVPYTGPYRLNAHVCTTMASGTRLRLGFATDTSGVIAVVLNKVSYQVNAGAQHHSVSGIVNLTKGQKVYLIGEQNTAGSVTFSTPISASADLHWEIEAL